MYAYVRVWFRSAQILLGGVIRRATKQVDLQPSLSPRLQYSSLLFLNSSMYAIIADTQKCCLDLATGVVPPDWLVNSTYLGTDTVQVSSQSDLSAKD